MVKIDIDEQVYEKIKEIAIPFVDLDPNSVLRRLIGLPQKSLVKKNSDRESSKTAINFESVTIGTPSPTRETAALDREEEVKYRRNIQNPEYHPADHMFNERIEKLRNSSLETHSAFLTFLMDKYCNTKGNYQTGQIIEFMKEINLRSPSGILRNPWMKAPYRGDDNGKVSCQRTIEHFRQTRKFGCWNGRNTKMDCNNIECQYHPESDSGFKNKCDLRNGVIWKREDPNSPFSYGVHYIGVVKKELLKSQAISLQPLLSVLYPSRNYDESLTNQFIDDFHFSDEEMNEFFTR